MSLPTILFVSHTPSQCGIFEYGKNIFNVLKGSRYFNFVRVECSSLEDLKRSIAEQGPVAIIYNYHPSVLPWVATKVGPRLYRNNLTSIKVQQIGIIHEITQRSADTATAYRRKFLPGTRTRLSNSLFDFYIAPDPALLLRNPYVYKTGRLLPHYVNNYPVPETITIGSFGFGTPGKGFDNIVRKVQQEFDQAVIRLNIPSSDFADKDGANGRRIAAACRALVENPGIDLQISHDYLDDRQVLDFLAQNTINVFLYEDAENRGLSSAVDNAVAVKRPVAVSNSIMFRHVLDTEPSINVEKNSLRTIIANGFAPLEKHYRDWNPETLLWEYERIMRSVLGKKESGKKPGKFSIRAGIRKVLSLPENTFSWISGTAKVNEDDMTVKESSYQPVVLPASAGFNRILDNNARKIYQPAIDKLIELVPKTMAKKIPEANVQQGFVFDTVYRELANYNNPKILCVGSYEDTAAMGLKKMGVAMDEIDPVLNYYLQEFVTKPTTQKGTYDIIFSTSVIEHDPDDESFIRCIRELLAPGGIVVLTCDYNDQWKQGMPLPEVDERFYTQIDLKDRLLPLMQDCYLVDNPQWDCLNPDFNYLGKYQYTFATFVVKRQNS